MTEVQKFKVKKRDGTLEPINLEKLHQALAWCAKDLDVSVSEVELKSGVQLFDGISTSDIHEAQIKSAADMISPGRPDYQYYAGRLAMFHVRKQVYGSITPPTLLDHVKKLTKGGYYDPEILEDYTDDEINIIDGFIDHDRDWNIAYSGTQQFIGKYLVQDRVASRTTGRYSAVKETPQFLNILIPMCLFGKRYSGEKRLELIKRFYDALSTFKLSLPTPIMSGVRTPSRQFSSCVLIECGDSLDSINATASASVKYISQRAGIGINIGQLRALGSPIRGGEAFHTGVIPFIKHFQTAIKSCSQGGVRGGAGTVYYPIWHAEAESLLVLKNNRGVEENRVRHLDYGVQINKLMYTRMMKGENITLFSPSDVPGLYEAFFADQVEFERLYLIYEQDDSIKKKVVKAIDIFTTLAQERAQTGRIYIQNVDHCNTHGAFNPKKAPVRQSNLCLEIALPTKPLNDLHDKDGEIALCTLSAFNLGVIESLDELEGLSELVVRSLDALLDYQDYPTLAAEIPAKARRSLGAGITNFAYYLAKNGVKYSDGSAKQLTHDTLEAIQYYLLKASNILAKEQGPCEWYNETSYAQGLLPIDTYKEFLDEIVSPELKLDWDSLRRDIAEHGLRNSTLTALMPCETSSQISNSTNGIEPPRGLKSVKTSKDGLLAQLVPGVKELRNNYELLWDIPDNKGYLELVGIMQKFVDQAISANTNYDPAKFEDDKLPIKQVLQDLLYAYKLGLKTLYYHNTRDGASDGEIEEENLDCGEGGCKI
ncbi:MAG: ribonucleoside-diphosphate reductase subunit alpha [Methyloprofundus sp.]|nr:ribonucleoside-diphosphate reductase subunit alpha [Methyloprofundus sp.]